MTEVSADPSPKSAQPKEAWVTWALVAQTAIAAATYLVAKRAMVELHPLSVVLYRFVLSGVLFAGLLSCLPGPALPSRADFKKLFVLGVLAGPLNQGLFLVGLEASLPSHAAFLYSLTPIGVYAVALVERRERFSWQTGAGVLVAFVGVLVLLLGGGLASAARVMLGDLIILPAVLAWVLYTTEGKKLSSEVGPIRATAWTMISACLCTLPLAPWYLRWGSLRAASLAAWGCIGFLSVATSVFSYLLWIFALSRAPASRVAVFSNLQPVVTALAAWALLGHALTWEVAAGGALVLGGVQMARRGAPS